VKFLKLFLNILYDKLSKGVKGSVSGQVSLASYQNHSLSAFEVKSSKD